MEWDYSNNGGLLASQVFKHTTHNGSQEDGGRFESNLAKDSHKHSYGVAAGGGGGGGNLFSNFIFASWFFSLQV